MTSLNLKDRVHKATVADNINRSFDYAEAPEKIKEFSDPEKFPNFPLSGKRLEVAYYKYVTLKSCTSDAPDFKSYILGFNDEASEWEDEVEKLNPNWFPKKNSDKTSPKKTQN